MTALLEMSQCHCVVVVVVVVAGLIVGLTTAAVVVVITAISHRDLLEEVGSDTTHH